MLILFFLFLLSSLSNSGVPTKWIPSGILLLFSVTFALSVDVVSKAENTSLTALKSSSSS